MTSRWTVARTVAVVATAAMATSGSAAWAAKGQVGALRSAASVSSPEGSLAPGIPLSPAQREAMRATLEARREAAASTGTGGPAIGADRTSRQTLEAADTEANSVRRNFRNSRAAQVSSTLAEPVAANDGTEVF